MPVPDAAERKGLGIFLRQVPSFRLALALYDDALLPAAIIRELSAELSGSGVRVLALDLAAGAQGKTLLAHVEAVVKKAALVPGERPAVMVLNLSACVDYGPELARPGGPGVTFLETANFHRELFPAACPGPFVVWVTETLENAIVRHAPDLWHWRSHTFDLRTRRQRRPALTAEQRILPSGDWSLPPEHRISRLLDELTAYRRAGSAADEARVLTDLGFAHLDGGDARPAKQDFEAALAIYRRIGDRHGEGAALGNLGLAHARLGDSSEAIDCHEQNLVIAREIGDRRMEGAALGNLGNAHGDLGDLREAVECYEQSLAITREIGDRRGEGNALGNLGTAHADLGDPRKAIECYEQNLVITREIGYRRGEGNALGNLGTAYADLGDVGKAIECYEQDLVIAREIGDRRGEGAALGNLGTAYADLGDTRKAIECYEQDLVIAREIGDRRGEGTVLLNLAAELWQTGERARAVNLLEASLRIHEEIEDPWLPKVRERLEHYRTELGEAAAGGDTSVGKPQ